MLTALFGSCSLIPPGESLVGEELKSEIADGQETYVKLISFQKTNGMSKDSNGAKLYSVEYRAEIEIKQDIWRSKLGEWQADKCVGNFCYLSVQRKKKLYPQQTSDFELIEKGRIVSYQGEMLFEYTENGWRKTDKFSQLFKF